MGGSAVLRSHKITPARVFEPQFCQNRKAVTPVVGLNCDNTLWRFKLRHKMGLRSIHKPHAAIGHATGRAHASCAGMVNLPAQEAHPARRQPRGRMGSAFVPPD